VAAVMVNHFNRNILPGGYLGVDIFFVISGYVITSSLLGRSSRNLKEFMVGFYMRRTKRLLPALCVFVLVMSIAICLFNPVPELSLWTGLTSLFGLSNLYLLKQSTDYFAQSTELNVFTHTWSLGVEEHFYILFPILIWFSGFGQQKTNGSRNLFLVVGLLTISSLIAFLYLYSTNQPAAYFLMPSRFWEMSAGCLLFIGFQKRASIEQLLEKVPPLLVLALIMLVMYLPMSMASASTILVVSLSSILIASLKKKTGAFKVFTNPNVVYIGLISYSLYLWHWGVLSISRWTVGIHWWSVPFQLALILFLADLSYRYIETPFRSGSRLGSNGTILVGSSFFLCSSLVLLHMQENPILNGLYVGQKKYNDYKSEPVSLIPEVSTGSCSAHTISSVLFLNKCIYRPVKTAPVVFLVGDSHASSYIPAVSALSKRLDRGFALYNWAATPFPAMPYERLDLPFMELKKSYKSMRIVEREILSLAQPGDVVLIVLRVNLYFGPEWDAFADTQFAKVSYIDDGNRSSTVSGRTEFFEEWISRVSGFARELDRVGSSVVVADQVPMFPKYAAQLCKGQGEQWFDSLNRESCDEPIATFYGEGGVYSKTSLGLSRLKGLSDNIYIFNPFPALCTKKEYCEYSSNGNALYRDSGHLSNYGSLRRVMPALVDFFSEKKL